MVSTLVVGSNTYILRSEADAILDNYIQAANWKTYGGADKDRALLSAFQDLDAETWLGARTEISTVVAVAINAGGTGYVKNDLLTIDGGVFGQAARILVVAESSGVISDAIVVDYGTYDGTNIPPASAATVSGGTGTGATFDLTFGEQVAENPRTGLTDCNSNSIDPLIIADEIKRAQALLAFNFIEAPAQTSTTGTGSNIKSAKAGSAAVEFFQPTTGQRYAPIIQNQIGCFLDVGADIISPVATGTGKESEFDCDDVSDLTQGYP